MKLDLSIHTQNPTPKTPTKKSITLNGGRIVSPVPFVNLSGSPSTPIPNKAMFSKATTPSPNFHKPRWKIILPKPKNEKKDSSNQTLQYQPKTENKDNVPTPDQNGRDMKHAVKNELFDLNFLQNFSFSLTFSLKKLIATPLQEI